MELGGILFLLAIRYDPDDQRQQGNKGGDKESTRRVLSATEYRL